MSKFPQFKVGDEVVYVNELNGPCSQLDLGRSYTVAELHSDPTYIILEKDVVNVWDSSRFELLSEWEKHQRPVDTATEFELCKIQIKSLQDNKAYLLAREKLLVEALEHLVERADDSDNAYYGTLGTSFVRDVAQCALKQLEEMK